MEQKEEIKPVKHFNAGLINRQNMTGGTDYLIVHDQFRPEQRPLTKFFGGMSLSDDATFEKWFGLLNYLLEEAGFSEPERKIILEYEKDYQSQRTEDQRSLIRESIEEVGLYPFRFSLTFENLKVYKDGEKVRQNFWFIKQYLAPEKRIDFRSKDKDVLGNSWVASEDLLANRGAMEIFHTHKIALEKAIESKKISEKISIKDLEVFI